MPFLFMIFSLVFFPFLAFAVLLILFLFLPLGFTVKYLPRLVFAPAKLPGIVFSKKIRANHGLAHGTINVLEEKYGPLDIEGLPEEDGFSLRGGIDPEDALPAAEEALSRIMSGEKTLAFRTACSVTSSLFFFSALFALVLVWVLVDFGFLSTVSVIACVTFVGRIAGPWVQRRLIFSLDLRDFVITGAEARIERKRAFGIDLMMPSSVFIRTRLSGEPRVAEVVS